MYDENGSLRRAQLGELIFSDKNARAKLNNILHPRILEILRQRISQLAECGASLVIVDAALIYESGIEAHFDKVVVVYAPLEQRLARLRQRDGLKTDSILERINAQLPLEKKVNRADFVVYNSFSLFALRRQARTLHAWLLALNRGKL